MTLCWLGEPHGPFVRRGVGCGTSESTMNVGPPECVRCGTFIVERPHIGASEQGAASAPDWQLGGRER